MRLDLPSIDVQTGPEVVGSDTISPVAAFVIDERCFPFSLRPPQHASAAIPQSEATISRREICAARWPLPQPNYKVQVVR